MDTCVIFCAGGFEKLARQPERTDYILAADGDKWAKQNNFLWLASNGFIDIPVEKLSDSQRRAFEKRVTP